MRITPYPDFDFFTLFSFDKKLYQFCDHRDINVIKKEIFRSSLFEFSFATQDEFYHKFF